MRISTDLGASPQAGGAVAPAPSGAADVLGNIGTELGNFVAKEVNDGRLEGAAEEFNTIADDQLAAEPTPEADVLVGPPTSRGSAEVELLGRIQTLRAGVDQATGSRKQSLELELRRKVEELGNDHPHLRAAYAQELSRFQRTDPEVYALGLLDAGDASFSAESAKDLEAIMSHAKGSIASGGLGMDPAKRVDLNWTREYTYKRAKRELTNNNVQDLTALQSGDQLDARASADTFQDSMQGQSNQVQGMIQKAMDMTQRVGKALTDPTVPNAAETISEWNNFGRQAVEQDILGAVMAIENSFSRIPISQANTDAYSAAKSLKDDQISALNILLEGVTSNQPTLTAAYEVYETMQKVGYERENREFVEDSRIILELAPILPFIEKQFGAQGDILFNELGSWLDQGLVPVLGRAYARTRNNALGANPTVEDITNHYRDVRNGADNLYDTGQTSTRAQQTMAITDAALKSSPGFLAMVDQDGLSPNVAATVVGSVGSEFDQYLTAGGTTADALEEAYGALQDKNWLKMAEVARTSTTPNTVQYLGDQAQAIALKYEPHRIAKYNTLRGTDVAQGIAAAQVITMDASHIQDGQVSFSVNADLIRLALREDDKLGPVTGVGGVRENLARVAIERATEVARELSQTVSRDLRSGAHAAALSKGSDFPVYSEQWVNARFEEFFGPAVQ